MRLALTLDTVEWLAVGGTQGQGAPVQCPRSGHRGRESKSDVDEIDLAGSNVAVSMGGDGTFLRVVRLAWAEDVPVLGVNFGRVGYLPDLVPDQVRVALTRVFDDKAVIEARCALEVESGRPFSEWCALRLSGSQ